MVSNKLKPGDLVAYMQVMPSGPTPRDGVVAPRDRATVRDHNIGEDLDDIVRVWAFWANTPSVEGSEVA